MHAQSPAVPSSSRPETIVWSKVLKGRTVVIRKDDSADSSKLFQKLVDSTRIAIVSAQREQNVFGMFLLMSTELPGGRVCLSLF
jgi:hypothetical protein